MQIKILIFGGLYEVIKESILYVEDVFTTNSLIENLNSKYPGLQDMQYQISVNKNIIYQNTNLKDMDELALLPPFAGG